MNMGEVFMGEIMMACGLKLHENATYIVNLEGKLLRQNATNQCGVEF